MNMVAPPRAHGRRTHKGITFARVIEAALAAFARHGSTASMDSIAASLGVRRTALCAHARTREELHALVSERVAKRITAGLRDRDRADRLLEHFVAEPHLARFLAHELVAGNLTIAAALKRVAASDPLARTTLALLLTLACGVDEELVRQQLKRLR